MTSKKPQRPHKFTGRTRRRSRRPMLGGLGAAIVSITDNHPLTHTDRRACVDHRQLPASHCERLRATDGRTKGRSNSSWGTTDKTADWKRSGGGDNEGGTDGRRDGGLVERGNRYSPGTAAPSTGRGHGAAAGREGTKAGAEPDGRTDGGGGGRRRARARVAKCVTGASDSALRLAVARPSPIQ